MPDRWRRTRKAGTHSNGNFSWDATDGSSSHPMLSSDGPSNESAEYYVCLASHGNTWLTLPKAPMAVIGRDSLWSAIQNAMEQRGLIADEEGIQELEIFNPVICEFVNATEQHAITMRDIPSRAKVRVVAEEKTYRQLTLTVTTPGLVTKPTKVLISVHSDDVDELRTELLKGLGLSPNVDCDVFAVSYPYAPKNVPIAERSEKPVKVLTPIFHTHELFHGPSLTRSGKVGGASVTALMARSKELGTGSGTRTVCLRGAVGEVESEIDTAEEDQMKQTATATSQSANAIGGILDLEQGHIDALDNDGAKWLYSQPRGEWVGFIDRTPFKNWDGARTYDGLRWGSYSGTRYFRKPELPTPGTKVIAIGVPCYNEQRHELKRTLDSLHECYRHKLWPGGLDARDYGVGHNGYYVSVLILLDGLEATSTSMRQYLEDLFSPLNGNGKPHHSPTSSVGSNTSAATSGGRGSTGGRSGRMRFDDAHGPMSEVASTFGESTFIVEREPDQTVLAGCRNRGNGQGSPPGSPYGGEPYYAGPYVPDPDDGDVGSIPLLHLYLLVKKDNRKKHNSHEWFLKAFCDDVGATFAFCTDCGTYFDPLCLKELVKYLEFRPDVSGCCGRQRIMPKHVQDSGDPVRDPSEGSPLYRKQGFLTRMWEGWMRAVQCYDFESSHAVDKPAFSAIGFMPVLPGPCGLFRYTEIRGRALEEYFGFVHTDTEDQDMVEANLTIAEDRILSLEACIHNNTGHLVTKWAEHALFYFEAELKLESFVQQRRRWNNGTAAGYCFLARDWWGKIWLHGRSKHRWGWLPWPCWQIAVTVMVFCELLKYVVVSLTPSIFIVGLHITLRQSWLLGVISSDVALSWDELASHVYVNAFTIFYTGLYIYFTVSHTKRVEDDPGKAAARAFQLWTFLLAIMLNTLLMILAFAGIIISVNGAVRNLRNGAGANDDDFISLGTSDSALILLPVAFIFAPLVITFVGAIRLAIEQASLRAFNGVWLMIRSFLPYYLFLPTMIAWYGAYAIARSADLKWGNRPDSTESGQDVVEKAKSLVAITVLANVVIAACVIYLSANTTFVLITIISVLIFSVFEMIISSAYFLTKLFTIPLRWCEEPSRRFTRIHGRSATNPGSSPARNTNQNQQADAHSQHLRQHRRRDTETETATTSSTTSTTSSTHEIHFVSAPLTASLIHNEISPNSSNSHHRVESI